MKETKRRGRPSVAEANEKMTQIHFWVPESLADAFTAFCEQHYINKSSLLRGKVSEILANSKTNN